MRGPTSFPTSSRWAAWRWACCSALLAGGRPRARRCSAPRSASGCSGWSGMLGEWVFKQEAMGGGDIKMMAMVGAFLGWQGVLLTIFLGALIGRLIFVPLALRGTRSWCRSASSSRSARRRPSWSGRPDRLVRRRTWGGVSRAAGSSRARAPALGACRGTARAAGEDAVLARLVDSLRGPVERAAGLTFRTPPRSALRSPAQVRAYLLASSTRSCRRGGCAGSRPPTACSGCCPTHWSCARCCSISTRSRWPATTTPTRRCCSASPGADRAPAPTGPGARDGARAAGPVPAARLDPQVHREQRPADGGAVDARGAGDARPPSRCSRRARA